MNGMSAIWEYKGNFGVKHLGPMAQDFHAMFGLGSTPKGTGQSGLNYSDHSE